MDKFEQADAGEAAPTVTPANDQLISRLADEYKILQDKIDKIGAFRFTIKGWSITVIIAALFAGTAANSVPPLLLLASLFVVLGLFFYVEKTQTDLSHYFGQRTISIETVLSRMLRRSTPASNEFVALRFIPGIAHHLGRQHSREQTPRSKLQSLRDADLYFYSIQALLVVAVVLLHGYGKKTSSSGDQVIIFHNSAATEPSLTGQRSLAESETSRGADSQLSTDTNKSGGGSGKISPGRGTGKNEKGKDTPTKNTKKKSG